MEDFVSQAKEILSRIIYITIATCSKQGLPWNSPVYSAFDEQHNFYWVSYPGSQHSKNIAENNSIFLVIYDSTAKEGAGRGVYVQAKASMLDDEAEISGALKLLYGRKNKPLKPVADFMGASPRRVYKAIPEKFWINTDDKIDGYHVDKRVEIKLI